MQVSIRVRVSVVLAQSSADCQDWCRIEDSSDFLSSSITISNLVLGAMKNLRLIGAFRNLPVGKKRFSLRKRVSLPFSTPSVWGV